MTNLYINGMTTLEDVTSMIKDTIDHGDLDSAKDYLDQLNDYLVEYKNIDPTGGFFI